MAALRRYAGLLGERDFRRLWLAQTVSQVGTQVTDLALPLVAILVLNASAFEVALLGAIEFLPFVFFTLPAGAWVDRLPKRRVLIAADLGRAAILALVPFAYLTGALAMWQLYVIGFSAGILTVFFEVAYQSILPELVDRDRLAEGNSRLEISRSAAQILGPGLGGFLVGVITAPMAILADALSYLGSAGFLFGIKTHARDTPATHDVDAAPRPSLRNDIAEGLRFYARSSLLLAESAAIVTMNLGSNISYSILLVFLIRELGLKPEAIGVAFSIGSIGVLAGAASAAAFGRRLGVGPALIVATAIVTGGAFLILLATPDSAFVLLLAMAAVQGFSGIIINVNGVSLRQSLTPDHLQGRVNATGRWINWSILPLAAILGGLIATAIGLRGTILVGAVIGLLSLPWLIFTPIRKLREMPRSPVGQPPA
ncbi:MAG TPA: MFS transporter [Candidatus Limnocylindrales bacterium]|nr:MFS transporter [Candidatus Limnocylindrales bacterium]